MDDHIALPTIRLLGRAAVQYQSSDMRLSSFGFAVLAILACDQGRWVKRSTIAGIVWPGKEESKARASLSQVVYTLKSTFPRDVLRSNGSHIMLDLRLASVDYTTFMGGLRQGNVDAALVLYSGPFLNEFPYISDDFDDWRIAKAALVDRLARDACERLVNDHFLSGEYERVADLCEIGIRIPTCSGAFSRLRVEALALNGDIAAARYELGELCASDKTGADLSSLSEKLDLFESSDMPSGLPDFFLPIVGRTSETQELLRHWDAIDHGCRVITISGDSGIGKSAFLRQSMKRLVLRGARCFHHKCVDFESSFGYAGLVATILSGARPCDLDLLDQEWIPSILSLAPEAFDGTPAMHPLYGEAAHRRFREATAQYFGAIAMRSPVVLAVDDFHLMDDASRQVLVYLTKRMKDRSILLLLTSGTGQLVPVTLEDDTSMVHPIVLAPLQEEDIDRLLNAFCSRHSYVLSDEMREELRNYSSGHPLLLVEVLRHASLVDSKNGKVELPSSIQGHVQNRVDNLDERSKLLLWAGATLTHSVGLDFLQHMTGLTPAESSIAAADLTRAGLLEKREVLEFRHDLIKDATRQCIPSYEKTMWHRRAAEAYRALDRTAAHLISLHFEAAGEMKLAYQYSRRAALKSNEQKRLGDAEVHILRMLRCAPPRMRPTPLRMILEHYSSRGQYNKLEPFDAELSTFLPKDPETDVLAAMVSFHSRQSKSGAYNLALEARAVLADAARRAPALLPRVLWQVGDHIKQHGEHALMRDFSELMQLMSREASSTPAAADMLSLAALMTGATDGFQQALPLANQAIELAALSDDEISITRAAFSYATNCIWAGQVDSAKIHYQAAILRAESSGLESILRAATANLAVVLMEQGELGDAQNHALRSLHDVGYLRRAYSYGNLALINLRLRNTQSARHYASAMAECNRISPQPWIPIHVEAILGTADILDGNLALASKRAAAISQKAMLSPILDDDAHIHVFMAKASAASLGYEAIEHLASRGRLTQARDYIGGTRMILESESLARSQDAMSVTKDTISEFRDYAAQNGAVLLAQECESLLT